MLTHYTSTATHVLTPDSPLNIFVCPQSVPDKYTATCQQIYIYLPLSILNYKLHAYVNNNTLCYEVHNWRSAGAVRPQVITFSIEPWCMTEEYIIPKTIAIYGASIYYSVGPKYRIIDFISACTYKVSVIGNVIQSVLNYLTKPSFMIKVLKYMN